MDVSVTMRRGKRVCGFERGVVLRFWCRDGCLGGIGEICILFVFAVE